MSNFKTKQVRAAEYARILLAQRAIRAATAAEVATERQVKAQGFHREYVSFPGLPGKWVVVSRRPI